jgi:DNA-binding GntR family transcriptional regulator
MLKRNVQHKIRQSAGPLHDAVRASIMDRIYAGEYAADAPLPSTPQLADEYGVSAITIKRALRDLQMAGVVKSVSGLGTFIRTQERFVHDLNAALKLYGSKEDAARASKKLQLRLLSVERREIKDSALLGFKPPPGVHLMIEKAVDIDDTPITLDRAYIVAKNADIYAEKAGEMFIYEIARKNKVEISHNRYMIDACLPDNRAQECFGLPAIYPMLRRAYHFGSKKEGLAVYGFAVSPFDRVSCSLDSIDVIHT